MKNSIKVLIVLMIISIQGIRLQAQTLKSAIGIYLNEQDYKSGKLSYVQGENDKLQLNAFLGGSNVNVSYEGKKIKLPKSGIFGYRMDNQDYRFYKNDAYKILDTAGFLLYSRPVLLQQGKGPKPIELFFFSATTAKPVQSLTVANISDSFAGLTDFRYRVQNHFRSDAALMAYDKTDHQYELKVLYFGYNQATTQQHTSL